MKEATVVRGVKVIEDEGKTLKGKQFWEKQLILEETG